MFFTIAVVAIALVSLGVHELGHACAMRECGVGVKRISLLGIPGLGTIRLPIKLRMFPGTEWFVHPFIVGAYVEPEEDDMERLSARDALYVYGAGPLASISFLLAICAVLASLSVFHPFSLAVGTASTADLDMFWAAVTFGPAFVLAFTWYFRKAICRYALLPTGCALAALVVYGIVIKGDFAIMGLSDLIGDIHSAKPERTDEPGGMLVELIVAVFFGGGLSALLGLVNLLPFVPLDGGQMMRSILPKRWQNRYVYLTLPIFVIMVFLQFGKDIYNLVRFLFW